MKPRTLLVDDDPNVFSALKRQLRSGFDVHTDTDPKITLIELGQSKPFAVVVSDYRMPQMNGIEF